MAEFIISAFADEAGDSLTEQIAALQRNGIRYMEIRNIDGKPAFMGDAEKLDGIHRQLLAAGISVSSIGSSVGKKPIEEDFEETEDAMKNAVRAAHILGARYIRLFSFYMKPEQYEEKRDEVLIRMNRLVELAAEGDVIPCHENESGLYGQNPDRISDLLGNVEGLGGIFDAANYLVNECDPIDGFLATLPTLEYMHIKDAVGGKERYITPAGEGDGKYAEIIAMADAAIEGPVFLTVEPHLYSFSGYAALDSHPLRGVHTYESPIDAFDTAVNALKKILTDLGFVEGENKVWKK